MTNEQILNALSYVIDIESKKNIVELGFVEIKSINDKKVSVNIKLKNPTLHYRKNIKDACEHYIKTYVSKDIQLQVDFTIIEADKNNFEIRNIVAIASGKGGVGKSTVTSNIAVGLVQKGFSVGIVDADIYGPSIPMMFDVEMEKPQVKEIEKKRYLLPVEAHGVKIMSIGFFSNSNQAVVWRGPIASKALEQMIFEVYWGKLDFLLVDLPPGTGDIHLTLIKIAKPNGAIIVSTPQPISLIDAKKGIAMFQLENINVPIVGLVENMSHFVSVDNPSVKHYIFGKDGVKKVSTEYNIPLLSQIPIYEKIRLAGDVGRPIILQNESKAAKPYINLVEKFLKIILKKK